MSDFSQAIGLVLHHEGLRFSDDPDDPGGPTIYGISLRFLRGLADVDGDGWLDGDLDRDGDVDADDIRSLTVEAAEKIYRTQWWDRYGYGQIPHQDVATKVLDLAVNMGAGAAHKLLQTSLRVTADGKLGPRSFAAIAKAKPAQLLVEFRARACEFYVGITERRPLSRKYRLGWLRRACA